MSSGVALRNGNPQELRLAMRSFRSTPCDYDPLSGKPWLQRLPPHQSELLIAARNYSLEKTVEIVDETLLRCSPGLSALGTFSSSRAASSHANYELTAILRGTDKSLKRETIGKRKPRDRSRLGQKLLTKSFLPAFSRSSMHVP